MSGPGDWHPAARLTAFAGAAVVAFFAAFGIAAVVVPESVVSDWTHGTHSQEVVPDAPASHDEPGGH